MMTEARLQLVDDALVGQGLKNKDLAARLARVLDDGRVSDDEIPELIAVVAAMFEGAEVVLDQALTVRDVVIDFQLIAQIWRAGRDSAPNVHLKRDINELDELKRRRANKAKERAESRSRQLSAMPGTVEVMVG